MTDKTGGKYILMSGLSLFAIGMGWVVLIAGPHSTWQDFLGPMIVAGLGMGGTFAPMTTVAMREVEPRMAGAASGMLNTVRQVGSVIGTAAVGALLQNRLVSALSSQAAIASAGAARAGPRPVRSGIEIGEERQPGGAGRSGGSTHLGPGLSARVAAQLARIGPDVFAYAYVLAMR